MMEKILSIENEYIAIIREILSNLHLEGESLVQEKPMHRCELLAARIALRKKARALRVEKDSLLKEAPYADADGLSELKYLELQKQSLVEKVLLQLKLNKNLKEVTKHRLELLPAPQEAAIKKKTLIL